jgi:hypothetical protein
LTDVFDADRFFAAVGELLCPSFGVKSQDQNYRDIFPLRVALRAVLLGLRCEYTFGVNDNVRIL